MNYLNKGKRVISFFKNPKTLIHHLRSFLQSSSSILSSLPLVLLWIPSLTTHHTTTLPSWSPPSSNPTLSLSQLNPSPNTSPKCNIISMISRHNNLDLDLILQTFNHAWKSHPNFAHNYETYLAMIKLPIVSHSPNPIFSNFFKSHKFYFIFSSWKFKWEKWLKMLKKSFHFWIFVSQSFSLDLVKFSFEFWIDFLFRFLYCFSIIFCLTIWIWLFWIMMVFWFSVLTSR